MDSLILIVFILVALSIFMIAIVATIVSAGRRKNRSYLPGDTSNGGFLYWIFDKAGNSDSSPHDHHHHSPDGTSHHHSHHHDSSGGHHGGFDGGGGHGGGHH